MKLPDLYINQKPPARIYEGGELVYPEPVKNGLVLWYDFMGRKNSDAKRGIAEDLSGNGNDGILRNFAYLSGSGYEDTRERDGENLITKTNYVEKNEYFEVTKSEETFNNMPVFKGFKFSNGSPPVYQNNIAVLPGQSFTFSVYVKIEKLDDPARANILFYDQTDRLVRATSTSKNILGWQRVSTTFTNDSGVVKGDMRPYLYLTRDAGEVTWFSSPMLTEGTEALEYRPSRTDPLYSEWAESKGFKRKLKFDGVDDSILVGDPVALKAISSISLEVSFISTKGGAYQRIIDKSWTFFSLALWGDNKVNINMGGVGGSNNFSERKYLPNKKYHFAVTFDYDTQTLSFYVNGESDFIKVVTGQLNHSPLPLYIGSGNSTSQLFQGDIFSTRIYNRALTPEEIAHNYAMEKERWNL